MNPSSPSHYVTPDQLCLGLYVHLDLPWFRHPFTFSSFRITNQAQIKELRQLGLARIRVDPEQSDAEVFGTLQAASPLDVEPTTPSHEPEPEVVDQVVVERMARIAARRERISEVERAFTKAAGVMRNVNQNLFARPSECLEEVGGLINEMVAAFLDAPESTLHVMSEKAGGEDSYYHGLNTSVLCMMLAKDLALPPPLAQTLGVAAMLHDLGNVDIPDRVLKKREALTHAEQELRNLHCEYGVQRAKQIGLMAPIIKVIAQHHELADGSGYPQRLRGDEIDPLARIVSLVNHYDNLCNPVDLTRAMTPHEALSMMFAQRRQKFDTRALQLLVRRLGVYPPGSIVVLSNDAIAMVTSVNSRAPLRPWVIMHDPAVPKEEAIMIDLEHEPQINISKALRPVQLPADVFEYLSPRKRVTYFFDAEPSAKSRS
jgi:HD-GYP domain-containing protein (c-di-GMP phosphodiesterase class II)